MMHYFIVAVCLAGVPSIDAQCLGVQFGVEAGTLTCSLSATGLEYGTKCIRGDVDGMGLMQRCDGGENIPSLCDAVGNPSTCCSMPLTSQMNQRIICADSFMTAPQVSDFSSCDTPCSLLTPGNPTTTPTDYESHTSTTPTDKESHTSTTPTDKESHTSTTPTVNESPTSTASFGSGSMCTASVVAMTGLVMALCA